MTIVRELTKKHFLMGDGHLSYEDLTDMQYCMVQAKGGAAPSRMTIGKPTAQGDIVYGVLQLEVTASGVMTEVQTRGHAEVRANAAISSGAEVTVSGTNGYVEAAATGDYVCGIAREAASGSGHLISIQLCGYYKP